MNVEVLSPAFMAALAGQIGALSAFLGGFAATFLVMLLMANIESRPARWAAVASALAAVSFIVAAVATTTLVAGAHPEAPISTARDAAAGVSRLLMSLCFALGNYALLTAIGCSGWLRSRKLGVATTTLAVLGGLGVTAIIGGL
ncbi:MAG: hypothetical protein RL093_1860 [Pseudomonadota bacterium]